MAVTPSFEILLLEIHQSLGLVPFQTKAKDKFADLGMSVENHGDMAEEILGAIFKALDMDEAAHRDAKSNLMEWAVFHKAMELHTWTSNVSKQQVLWQILGSSYAPAMARRIAFWNLEGAFDKGMPGGKFWFLPHLDPDTGKVELPVPQVVSWLLDLLGLPMDEAKLGLGGNRATGEASQDSIERNLYNWQAGNLPNGKTIKNYFSDDASSKFKGIFLLEEGLSEEARFCCALDFATIVKQLNAVSLRDEIPMTQPGRLESILDQSAPDEDKKLFVDLILARYAQPSMHTIRQRLLAARMVQDGYERLLKCLCPGVDKHCPDPKVNKLLQLAGIFKCIYSASIAASKHGETEAQENEWFESHLPPLDKADLFLSILPSSGQTGYLRLATLLTRRFAKLADDAPLEDFVGMDEASTLPIIERKVLRLKEEAEEDLRGLKLVEQLRAGSAWRALQVEDNYWVVSQIPLYESISAKARQAAIQRTRELATTPNQVMGATVMELALLLNCSRRDRPRDVKDRVEMLLTEACHSPSFDTWKAPILQYQAKHLLAQNDFEAALPLFRRALAACSERNFGTLRGEIARDTLALEVADQGLIPGNHEKYFRNMLAFGIFEQGSQDKRPTLENTAVWASEYFWDDLYKPYPGVESRKPIAAKQMEPIIQGTLGLIFDAKWEELSSWMQRHASKLRVTKIREVRGNTVLMSWLKALDFFKKRLPIVKTQIPYCLDGEIAKIEVLLKNWHQAIAMLADAWPEQINLADFKRQTPLMLVADAGDELLVRAFLATGADANTQDYQGRTALHAAITGRSLACVVALLERMPDTRKSAETHQTVLHSAVRMGHCGIVRTLVEYDPGLASLENDQGQTPLALAKIILEDLPKWQTVMAKHNRQTGTRQDFEEIVLLFMTAPTIH